MCEQKPKRGRPPKISRKRIAEAGIEVGLPKITFVGVASQLGVSHMALYKHISGLEMLKQLVAEEIFLSWSLPEARDGESLEAFLMTFSASLWSLVAENPGIAPYLLREDMITPAMVEKINTHQLKTAETYNIDFEQSRWLLFTVAYHTVAVADTVLPVQNNEARRQQDVARKEEQRIDDEYYLGVRALIIGALSLISGVDKRDPSFL
ncbi:TetR/AcrR family transcriptional regulator [Nisaea sp.]|uniref:TetR/AcrR family transcriptional regulator n=1 Tax=Nisaea sp. TaxID=2024842 RepID=UPI0032974950